MPRTIAAASMAAEAAEALRFWGVPLPPAEARCLRLGGMDPFALAFAVAAEAWAEAAVVLALFGARQEARGRQKLALLSEGRLGRQIQTQFYQISLPGVSEATVTITTVRQLPSRAFPC
eukprot:jgi/Psemu1/6772/gm1.6772_g